MSTISTQVQYVDLSAITSGNNPYGPTRTDDVTDILKSLKSKEDILLLPPIHINQEGHVLAGERRFEAITKFAELANDFDITVPVVYRQLSHVKEGVVIAINENERRKNATPIEMATAFASALQAGFTHKDACALFVKPNGKQQDLAWGSMMTRIWDAIQLSQPFRKACIRYELAYRTIYDYASLAFSKSEDMGKVQEILDKLAEKIKQKALEAQQAPQTPEPNPEPSDTQKPLSTKKVIKFADEAGDLLKERVKESLKVNYAGPRIQESDAAAAASVLKYVKLIIGGTLTVEQFLKKFHIEGVKEPKGSTSSKQEPAEGTELTEPTKTKKKKETKKNAEVEEPTELAAE